MNEQPQPQLKPDVIAFTFPLSEGNRVTMIFRKLALSDADAENLKDYIDDIQASARPAGVENAPMSDGASRMHVPNADQIADHARIIAAKKKWKDAQRRV